MRLRILLRSDTAFGRGDGIAGLIDSEFEHDSSTGFPIIKGRTLKGLLVESCADILYALETGQNPAYRDYYRAAAKLFGIPGSTLEDTGCLHIGVAQLAEDLRIHASGRFSRQEIIDGLTVMRRQTSVDAATDKPLDGTLRTTRAVMRGVAFYSHLHSDQPLDAVDIELIAACAAGLRAAGQNRTRGMGWLAVSLLDTGDGPLINFVNRIGGHG